MTANFPDQTAGCQRFISAGGIYPVVQNNKDVGAFLSNEATAKEALRGTSVVFGQNVGCRGAEFFPQLYLIGVCGNQRLPASFSSEAVCAFSFLTPRWSTLFMCFLGTWRASQGMVLVLSVD